MTIVTPHTNKTHGSRSHDGLHRLRSNFGRHVCLRNCAGRLRNVGMAFGHLRTPLGGELSLRLFDDVHCPHERHGPTYVYACKLSGTAASEPLERSARSLGFGEYLMPPSYLMPFS
jgi:hypothetical protein